MKKVKENKVAEAENVVSIQENSAVVEEQSVNIKEELDKTAKNVLADEQNQAEMGKDMTEVVEVKNVIDISKQLNEAAEKAQEIDQDSNANPDGEQQSTQQSEQDNAQQSEQQSEDNKAPKKVYVWKSDVISVRSLLRRYKESKIIIPACQRMYVWNEKQRKSLLQSIKKNLPCGSITLCEYNGVAYQTDGQQRTISTLLLSGNEKLSEEVRRLVLDYKILVVTVKDMDLEELKDYFAKLNSGTPLAAPVKARASLAEDIENIMLDVASAPFFRNLGQKSTATFNKSAHNELIAQNILLAVSDVEIGDNKAAKLASRMSDNEERVKANYTKAEAIVNTLSDIYDNLNDDVIKRSANASFLGILPYVMVKNPQYTIDQYVRLVSYIFASKNRAVPDYSATTGQGSADSRACKKRYAVIVNIMENRVLPEDRGEIEIDNTQA